MVKIRLAQTGSRNRRTYRFVCIEEGKKRGGRAIEILGFYNPLTIPPELQIKKDRIDYWLSQGAQLTPAVKNLMEKHP